MPCFGLACPAAGVPFRRLSRHVDALWTVGIVMVAGGCVRASWEAEGVDGGGSGRRNLTRLLPHLLLLRGVGLAGCTLMQVQEGGVSEGAGGRPLEWGPTCCRPATSACRFSHDSSLLTG